MKMDTAVANLLQTQVNNELSAALLYDQVAYDLEEKAWKGTAAYFRKMAEEEREHSRVFANYLLQRGERPTLTAITPPTIVGVSSNPVGAFNIALNIETTNEVDIRTILTVAIEKRDHVTVAFLQPLILDQNREVAEVQEYVTVLTDFMTDKATLCMFDKGLS